MKHHERNHEIKNKMINGRNDEKIKYSIKY